MGGHVQHGLQLLPLQLMLLLLGASLGARPLLLLDGLVDTRLVVSFVDVAVEVALDVFVSVDGTTSSRQSIATLPIAAFHLD